MRLEPYDPAADPEDLDQVTDLDPAELTLLIP